MSSWVNGMSVVMVAVWLPPMTAVAVMSRKAPSIES